jgi:transcriptional regulator with XRE-family HTH domain
LSEINRRRIARVVAAARKARGLQQTEVAHGVGLPVSSVSRLETGHTNAPRLTLELIGRLSEVLEIYPEALFPKDGPYHAMAMLRGRLNTHFLCLGQWSKLPELFELCFEEIHRFRPDIVGMALLNSRGGGSATKHCSAYGATLGGLRIAPQQVPVKSARVQRSRALAQTTHRGPGQWNILAPTLARIPGCDLARRVIEMPSAAGTLWFALSHEHDPEEDPELHPVARTGIPWHVGDVFARGLANLRGLDDADHGDPTIETLLDRLQRIETALEKGRVR